MNSRLVGRVAVVTGAGSGIGRAVAVRLAREGASVVVGSRTESHVDATCAEIENLPEPEPEPEPGPGPRAIGVVADLTDKEAGTVLVKAALEAFGRIDVVSNNAGIDLFEGPLLEDTTDAVWAGVIDVNLTGTMRVCRAAIPHLQAGASIVNMGSVNSLVAWPNNAAYSSSKGAVLMFSRALALELADRGIRVNCVCPGVIDTPLTGSFLRGPDAPQLQREYESYAPLKRLGTSDEVANCVAFLACDESSFVTGSALVVDGGATAR